MATPAPVLIVDGNPQMTALLQRYLARQRVDAQAVSSLAEAQAALVQQAFGVVLTDAFVRAGDGLALLRYLRQTVPGTRGILMTAFRAPDLCRQALDAGAYACLLSLSSYRHSGTLCSPPYRAYRRQRRADTLTSVDEDKRWGARSPLIRVRAEGKARGVVSRPSPAWEVPWMKKNGTSAKGKAYQQGT